MAGSTAEDYRKNPEARKRRLKQQSAYQKTEKGSRIKRNANKLNRKLGTYGMVMAKMLLPIKGVLLKEDFSLHLLIVKADLKFVNDPTSTNP